MGLDLFIVHDRMTDLADQAVVVRAPSAPEAVVEAVPHLPVAFRYSDGTAGARKFSVYRAEKVGEFTLAAEED